MKAESYTVLERIHRRISPKSFRRQRRQKAIKAALRPWGGSNLAPNHPIFFQSMFKQPAILTEEVEILLNVNPGIPFIVDPKTADPNPFRQVILEQQYSDTLKFAPKARSIIDLGANVGYASLWFAIQYPDARICVVEPLKSNFLRIQRQVDAAGLGERIKALHAAVGVTSGFAELYSFENGFFHTSASLIQDEKHQTSVERVQCMTLMEIVESSEFSTPEIIKMDIEGTEEKLFEHEDVMAELLQHVKVFAIEIHKSPPESSSVHSFFRKHGWNYSLNSEVTTFYC